MIPDGRTPVVVVTGFLGSGKTTLVNRLVKVSDSLVIVNEFGEVPVDHALEGLRRLTRPRRLRLRPLRRRGRDGRERSRQ